MTVRTAENRCVPHAEWPFVDRAAWDRGLLPFDPFDPTTGLASRWRASTQKAIAGGYGRWLGWLALTEAPLLALNPGARASRERVTTYRDALRLAGLADYTVSGLIKQLGEALSVIDPRVDSSWIRLAAARMHAKAKPKRQRLDIMQPPADVLQLGRDLMQAAESDRFRTPCDRATLFRDGLLLSFLTLRPFRRGNLTNLTLGRELEFRDAWMLNVGADQTKGDVAIVCEWPPLLVGPLERYLKLHRRVLRQGAAKPLSVDALWISRQGGPMTSDAISYQVKSRTKQEFGKAINLHTFRSIAATAVATSNPRESSAIAEILSHKSMGPSEKYYNRANALGAGGRMQANLEQLRGTGTGFRPDL